MLASSGEHLKNYGMRSLLGMILKMNTDRWVTTISVYPWGEELLEIYIYILLSILYS